MNLASKVSEQDALLIKTPTTAQNRPKSPNSISPEPLLVRGWLTPLNDRKHQVSISVSHNVYPSDNRKCPFWPKMCQKGKYALIRYLMNDWSYEVG